MSIMEINACSLALSPYLSVCMVSWDRSKAFASNFGKPEYQFESIFSRFAREIRKFKNKKEQIHFTDLSFLYFSRET